MADKQTALRAWQDSLPYNGKDLNTRMLEALVTEYAIVDPKEKDLETLLTRKIASF